MKHDTTDMRMTRQRQVIIEELRKMHTHPTADELFRRVQQRIPNISLATVYRNLKLLVQAEVITEIQSTGSYRRYDGNVGNHYHLLCIHCGRVDDANVPPDRNLQKAVNRTTGYEILAHRVEFMGLCPACRHASQDLNGSSSTRETDRKYSKKTHK